MAGGRNVKWGEGWALPQPLPRPDWMGWMGWRTRPLGAVAPAGGRRLAVPRGGFAHAGGSTDARWRHDVRAVLQRLVPATLPPPMKLLVREYSQAGGQKLQARPAFLPPPWAGGVARAPWRGPVAPRAQPGRFAPEIYTARGGAAFAAERWHGLAVYAPADAAPPRVGLSGPPSPRAVSVAPVRKVQTDEHYGDEITKLYNPVRDKFEHALSRPRPAPVVPQGHWQQRRALEDLLNHQARLPPAGDIAFNPQLSPAWAGLKIP